MQHEAPAAGLAEAAALVACHMTTPQTGLAAAAAAAAVAAAAVAAPAAAGPSAVHTRSTPTRQRCCPPTHPRAGCQSCAARMAAARGFQARSPALPRVAAAAVAVLPRRAQRSRLAHRMSSHCSSMAHCCCMRLIAAHVWTTHQGGWGLLGRAVCSEPNPTSPLAASAAAVTAAAAGGWPACQNPRSRTGPPTRQTTSSSSCGLLWKICDAPRTLSSPAERGAREGAHIAFEFKHACSHRGQASIGPARHACAASASVSLPPGTPPQWPPPLLARPRCGTRLVFRGRGGGSLKGIRRRQDVVQSRRRVRRPLATRAAHIPPAATRGTACSGMRRLFGTRRWQPAPASALQTRLHGLLRVWEYDDRAAWPRCKRSHALPPRRHHRAAAPIETARTQQRRRRRRRTVAPTVVASRRVAPELSRAARSRAAAVARVGGAAVGFGIRPLRGCGRSGVLDARDAPSMPQFRRRVSPLPSRAPFDLRDARRHAFALQPAVPPAACATSGPSTSRLGLSGSRASAAHGGLLPPSAPSHPPPPRVADSGCQHRVPPLAGFAGSGEAVTCAAKWGGGGGRGRSRGGGSSDRCARLGLPPSPAHQNFSGVMSCSAGSVARADAMADAAARAARAAVHVAHCAAPHRDAMSAMSPCAFAERCRAARRRRPRGCFECLWES
eukprot:354551-Chlamydomonas_euryale.AAC.19